VRSRRRSSTRWPASPRAVGPSGRRAVGPRARAMRPARRRTCARTKPGLTAGTDAAELRNAFWRIG